MNSMYCSMCGFLSEWNTGFQDLQSLWTDSIFTGVSAQAKPEELLWLYMVT